MFATLEVVQMATFKKERERERETKKKKEKTNKQTNK
jgi:hypothetical protein